MRETKESLTLALLPPLHSNQGDQLQLDMHLSSTKSATEGGPDDRMH